MELVKIDYKEFGLEQSKAESIEAAFAPLVKQMVDLEPEYIELIAKYGDGLMTEEMVEEATTMLKKYVTIRTSTDTAHKKEKAVFRQSGLFIDGLKNGQRKAGDPREAALKTIKDYYVNIEKARLADLQLEREKAIKPYLGEFEQVQSYSGIPDAQWDALLTDKKLTYQAKLDLIKKQLKDAEDERLENEHIRKENKANSKIIAEQAKKLKELENDKVVPETIEPDKKSEKIPYTPGIKDIYTSANNMTYDEFKDWYTKHF